MGGVGKGANDADEHVKAFAQYVECGSARKKYFTICSTSNIIFIVVMSQCLDHLGPFLGKKLFSNIPSEPVQTVGVAKARHVLFFSLTKPERAI